MIENLIEIFPRITGRQLYRLLLSIKCKYRIYGIVGISRLQGKRYGISERQMNKLISFMVDMGIIEYKGKRKAKQYFCNVYSLGEEFLKDFLGIKSFIKKAFEYINIVDFVKSNFNTVTKWGRIIFKHNGNKYIVQRTGRFKDKIYGITEDQIINPYLLIN